MQRGLFLDHFDASVEWITTLAEMAVSPTVSPHLESMLRDAPLTLEIDIAEPNADRPHCVRSQKARWRWYCPGDPHAAPPPPRRPCE